MMIRTDLVTMVKHTVKMLVITYVLNTDIWEVAVAAQCFLNVTGYDLETALASRNRGEFMCPPGYLASRVGGCEALKNAATMPFWNHCRSGFSCTEKTCGPDEEVVSKCNSTHFIICRPRTIVTVSTVWPSTSTVTVQTVWPSTSTAIFSSTAKTIESSCVDNSNLHIVIGFMALVIIIILAMCLIWCYYNKRSRKQEWSPAGRKNLPQREATKYHLRENPAGTAVLIVNPDRKDIKPDLALCERIFKMLLGSKTKYIRIDASSLPDIKDKITDIKTAGDLGDAFACLILGHGKEEPGDGLECQDKSYLRLDILTNWFNGVQCDQLVGKPKLFFHVCCRGDSTEDTVYVQGSGNGGAGTMPITTNTADILISFASSNGKEAYFEKDGSMFLLALKEAMKTWGKTEDILSILTQVSEALSGQDPVTHKDTGELVKQQPIFHSTLRHKFFLKSGDSGDDDDAEEGTGSSTSATMVANGHPPGYMLVDMHEDNGNEPNGALQETSREEEEEEEGDTSTASALIQENALTGPSQR